MEENKNQLENTDHGMKENSVAPETPFHESEPGERGSREDTSYSYGEYRREGAPYQAQDHGSQGEWDSTPLTMGDWLLTLLAAFIPWGHYSLLLLGFCQTGKSSPEKFLPCGSDY